PDGEAGPRLRLHLARTQRGREGEGRAPPRDARPGAVHRPGRGGVLPRTSEPRLRAVRRRWEVREDRRTLRQMSDTRDVGSTESRRSAGAGLAGAGAGTVLAENEESQRAWDGVLF